MRFRYIQRVEIISVLAVFLGLHSPLQAQGPFGVPSENSAFSFPRRT